MAAPCINHHEALSGLTPGLITPRDLPGSNTDGDIQLMLLLYSGFGQLRLQLGHLELVRMHTYLLYDEGIRRPKQGTWQVGLKAWFTLSVFKYIKKAIT